MTWPNRAVHDYVWDSGTMSWVAETQPGGSSGGATIGAAVPSTAAAIAVKDNSGNLAYPNLDGSGNLLVAVTGAGSGGTSSTDRATWTAGTTAGTPAMAAFDDTSPAALAEDKVGILRASARRELYVQVRDAAGNERGLNIDSGGALAITAAALPLPALAATSTKQSDGSQKTQIVDGSGNVIGATSNALDINIKSGNITGFATAAKQPALGTAGSASTDVITVQGIASMTALKVDGSAVTQPVSGTFWQATQPISASSLPLPSGASTAVKQPALGTAGTASADVITVQGIASMTKLLVTPDANSAVNVSQINGVTPLMGAGNTGTGSHRVTLATDQAAIATWGLGATGSAVPSGASYEGGIAKTALPTAASDGNLTGVMLDKYGRQVVLPCSIRDLVGTQTTTISASTSETTIVSAAASIFNDLVMLIISNTSASTNTRIDFRDTTSGTVLFSVQSVGGAAPVGFALNVPIPQTSVNTNWTAQCATSTTDVRIYAVFVKNK